jgi:hypothetical protein
MNNKKWLIIAMVLIPIVGLFFNIYALFLIIPLGFFFKKNKMD